MSRHPFLSTTLASTLAILGAAFLTLPAAGAAAAKAEKGEPLTRLDIAHTVPSSNNYDGIAVSYCLNELMDNAVPDEQLVLIVLSDGLPSGPGFSGESGMRYIRQVTDNAARKGVMTVQIAIDHGLDAVRQSKMYANWLPFETDEKLPVQLTQLLKRVFPGR